MLLPSHRGDWLPSTPVAVRHAPRIALRDSCCGSGAFGLGCRPPSANIRLVIPTVRAVRSSMSLHCVHFPSMRTGYAKLGTRPYHLYGAILSRRAMLTTSVGKSLAGEARVWRASTAGPPALLRSRPLHSSALRTTSRVQAVRDDSGATDAAAAASRLESICVVLVNPTGAQNVGQVARSMNNFGLQNLRLVTPGPFVVCTRCRQRLPLSNRGCLKVGWWQPVWDDVGDEAGKALAAGCAR